jgi:hypothetical protein
MIPPPAPARPLISASDIFPLLVLSNLRPSSLPRFAGRRIPAASRAKLDSTPPPQRVASAACCSVSLDCGRRKRGLGVGVGVGVAGGVEDSLGSARPGAPSGPVSRAFLFVKLNFMYGT